MVFGGRTAERMRGVFGGDGGEGCLAMGETVLRGEDSQVYIKGKVRGVECGRVWSGGG